MTTKNKREGRSVSERLDSALGPLTLGEVLRAARVNEGMSQTEFAELIGCSKQYVSAVENGRKLLGFSQACRFAEILKHDPDVFLKLAVEEKFKLEGLEGYTIVRTPGTKVSCFTVDHAVSGV